MIKGRFILIDAFALIFRAYHGMPPFTDRKGRPVGAVYGFTSALLSAIKTLEPEYLAVGFDLPTKTVRHAEYVEYKAHRAPTPDDLMAQVPFVKDVLKAFNIPIFSQEGYEGEDVLATIVAKIRSSKSEIRNIECIIVTGDLDCLQLIDSQTKVYSMARGVNQATMYDTEKVKERYGLTPQQFVDFKALKGDASDNIPGVPGIGEKGAAGLIKQFGSLEKLYQEIGCHSERSEESPANAGLANKLPDSSQAQNDKKMQKNNKNLPDGSQVSERLQKILIENKEQAFLSQKLSKIVDNIDIDFHLSSAKIHDYDQNKVIKLFEEYNFKSLIKRLPDEHREDLQQKLL